MMTHAATLDAIITKVVGAANRADALQARLDATDRREMERMADKLRAKGTAVMFNRDISGHVGSVTVAGRKLDLMSFAEMARAL